MSTIDRIFENIVTTISDTIGEITGQKYINIYNEINTKCYHNKPISELKNDFSRLSNIVDLLPKRKYEAAKNLQQDLSKRLINHTKNSQNIIDYCK